MLVLAASCCGRPPCAFTPSPPGRPGPSCCSSPSSAWRSPGARTCSWWPPSPPWRDSARPRACYGHARRPAFHLRFPGDRRRRRSLRLPGPLAERALAGRHRRRSLRAAGHLAGHQRRGGLPEAYAPIPHRGCWLPRCCCWPFTSPAPSSGRCCAASPSRLFETAQCALAFLIGVGGGTAPLEPVVRRRRSCAGLRRGLLRGVVRAARPRGSHGRNFYTYSTFGILLALAGSRILLSGCRRVGRVAGPGDRLHLGRRFLRPFDAPGARRGLPFAGAGFLGRARTGRGLPAGHSHVARREAGRDWRGRAGGRILLPAGGPPRRAAERGTWSLQAFRLVVAGALVWLAAGTAAGALTTAYHALFGAGASHAYCATLHTRRAGRRRSLLAWAGSRWNRLELSPLDLPGDDRRRLPPGGGRSHQDRKAALFLSLLLYGAALMALPRWHRTSN